MGETLATPCSNCVYRGTHYCGIICGRSRFWLFFISLLLFAVSSWADCLFLDDVTCAGGWTCYGSVPSGFPAGNCNLSRLSCGSDRSYGVITEAPYCGKWNVVSMRGYCCGTQAQADSVQCVNEGNTWVNGECRGPIDSTVCDTYRAQCAQLGGVFEGEPLEDGCSATCNTCGNEANKKILEVKSRSCCSQGLAPSIDQMCTTPLESGIGMTVSSNANLECSDPNLSDEALQSYVDNCSNNNNSNPESSESGPSPTSSEGGSSPAPDSAGLGQDYYPILDTIRDSLLDIRRNVETITTCLVSPGTCAGLMGGGDTVIVNASDSTYIKQLGTKLDGLNSTLDTSVQNSNERLQESVNLSISRANDSLIDSMRKYLNSINSRGDIQEMDSANRFLLSGLPAKNASAVGSALGYGDTASTNLRGDLNAIRAAIEGFSDSMGGFGGGFDTAMYGGNYGARSVDTSYGSWINTMSNRYANLARNASGGTWGDTATLETVFRTTYEDTVGNSPQGQDSIAEAQYSYLSDSAEIMLARAKDSLLKDTSLLRSYYDTLKTEMQIWNWDSILIGPIRDAIPDNNSCPEDCFKGQFALPGTGDIAYDFGLCRRWPILMDQDVFMFIRILLRLITAVSCIYIGMWTIAGRKD